MSDLLCIHNKNFKSRLLLGTGKFSSPSIMKSSLEAAGAEIITAAIRRVDLHNPVDPFTSIINPDHYLFLPNTSGARNAEEAVRIANLAKPVSNWIKLEITPEPNFLLADPIETLKAAELLVKLGFIVFPYIQADPILAKRLEEVGCATVMPLASPIGSNQGLKTKEFLQMIISQSNVPVIVDAGLGSPSHAAEALELGADAVLVNTAIATANFPILMAEAFKLAVQAGRKGFLSGIPTTKYHATSSSPLTGFLHTSL